jgi:dienelactone hydrolase
MTIDREKHRKDLYGLLGDLPPISRWISSEIVKEEEHKHFILEKLLLDLNGIEPVPAYFVKPKGYSDQLPAVLFNHSHGGLYSQGKDELTFPQSDYMYRPGYAEELARVGVCSLSIDMWAFGERRGRTESQIFKEMLWSGQVMWGMMVYDSLRAIDYLVSRPEVDVSRIGTLGMSMGSTMAWWIAALDERIKVCVDICCLTDFQDLIDTNGLDLHGVYYYIPNLLKHFTTAQINALIAPRAHLSLAGNYDPLTPSAGLDRIDKELKRVYGEYNAQDAWKLIRYDVGHVETASMRRDVLNFLGKWL